MQEEKELNMQVRSLLGKLAVRDCQYDIALEGLQTIRDSNDPMGIAEKTINAMLDCLPK